MKLKPLFFSLLLLLLISAFTTTASAFDNDGGDTWQKYVSFPVTTTPSEYAQYKLVIEGNTWSLYNTTDGLESQGTVNDFWSLVQSDGSDIRVFDQSNNQLYFWVESWNYTNQKATIWVNLPAGSTELNIAYSNPSATLSTYNNPEQVFEKGMVFVKVSESPDINSHQGVTASENNYYTIHTDIIYKRSKVDWSAVAQNTDPFTGLPTGVNHLGDGNYYNGKLYVPVQNWVSCDAASTQVIAIYNADTLELIDYHDIESYVTEASGVAINPDDGIVYVSNYCEPVIYKFSLTDFSYLGSINLPTPPFDADFPRIQGIAYKDGFIYLSSERDGRIYKLDRFGNVIGVAAWVDNKDYNEFTWGIEGIAFDTEGKLLWLIDKGTQEIVYIFEEQEVALFDTFDNGLNTGKWQVDENDGNVEVVDGALVLTAPSSSAERPYVWSSIGTGDHIVLMGKIKQTSATHTPQAWVFGLGDLNYTNGFRNSLTNGVGFFEWDYTLVKTENGTRTTLDSAAVTLDDQWREFMLIASPDYAKWVCEGKPTLEASNLGFTPQAIKVIWFSCREDYGQQVFLDDIKVAKYADPADFGTPTINDIQPEPTPTPTPSPTPSPTPTPTPSPTPSPTPPPADPTPTEPTLLWKDGGYFAWGGTYYNESGSVKLGSTVTFALKNGSSFLNGTLLINGADKGDFKGSELQIDFLKEGRYDISVTSDEQISNIPLNITVYKPSGAEGFFSQYIAFVKGTLPPLSGNKTLDTALYSFLIIPLVIVVVLKLLVAIVFRD